ncbi:unnamed protein product [Urochloa humidicola]
MAGVQELPRRCGPYHFVALLGASLLVLSVSGEPPVHAGCAIFGFLLWLLGVARLLLFGPIGLQRPVFRGPGALEGATATARLFFPRQAPEPEPQPAAAPPV